MIGAHCEARLGKKSAGASRVVGVLGDVRVVPLFVCGSFGPPERLAPAEEDTADQSFAVDPVRDGLAEASVGEPGQFMRRNKRFSRGVVPWVLVEPDETRIGGGTAVENRESVAGGVAVDPGNIVGGESLGVGLSRGKGEGAGVGILDQFCDEIIDVGKADSLGVGTPVVRVGLEDDAFGGLIGAEAKGSRGEKTSGFLLGDAHIPCFQEGAV